MREEQNNIAAIYIASAVYKGGYIDVCRRRMSINPTKGSQQRTKVKVPMRRALPDSACSSF